MGFNPHSLLERCLRLLTNRERHQIQGDKTLFKKTIAVGIAGILISMALGIESIYAGTKAGKEVQLEKIRADIYKLGIGKDARVEVKLRDKTKLQGYISEVSENSFTVTDLKTEVSSVVAYPNVRQVKGHNLTTRTKILIGVAIAAGVGIALFYIRTAINSR
jgi:hypothetical protein